MIGSMPRETRRTVCVIYLGGKTLDLIADLTGISKTSVFNIVQETASHDPDYVLMRTLAVNLEKNGSDLSQYASIIRISSLLEEYGWILQPAKISLENFFPHVINCSGPPQTLCSLYRSFHSRQADKRSRYQC